VELARPFAAWVRDDPRFELAVPPVLNLVCFCHRSGDAFNERLLQRLNTGGRIYLTHTRLAGRFVLRLCVGQTHTEERHVRQAWELIRQTARELEKVG
jgi:aromatic-L-amino-acid decarboxylase